MIALSLDFGEPVHIVSPPGYGKTTGLKYLIRHYDGYHCQVGQTSKSARDMYFMLLTTFDIYHDCRTTRDLRDKLIFTLDLKGRLSGGKRILMAVDEAQTLEATAQRELLSIQEECNLAFVMAGNGERLATRRMDKGAWEQVADRLGEEVNLPPLDEQDCEIIGCAFGVEEAAARAAVINFGLRTNVRRLVRLLTRAESLAAGTASVRLAHLQQAVTAIYGITSARDMLKPDSKYPPLFPGRPRPALPPRPSAYKCSVPTPSTPNHTGNDDSRCFEM
ncbi:DNA transposition AAA+ family ATPase [Pseudochelatococcus lubricantis]|uniref:DNA transposition AAA+ family ATPase n=1 Tax=Pseudochelatococcus lubricantis TaxID=1538102 RepID=A0ABX0V4F6_9HYPH|nr:ATP-binding protein [Pseudochelatococcus lubricantis]NIJ60086.1 DNA transposition AAA+ family ATPase [Pseudochelatococcus lubricantis]